MPDGADALSDLVSIPAWLAALVLIGTGATAVTGIIRLLKRIGRDMTSAATWMKRQVSEAVGGIVDERVSPELDRIEHQLKDKNNGSMRELVNRVESKLDAHVEWSAKVMQANELDHPDHPELEDGDP